MSGPSTPSAGGASPAGDPRGVEQDTSVLHFAYKDPKLSWELRSEVIQDGDPKLSLVLNLSLNGVGDVRQIFPLSHDNQIQVVMWLARQLGVDVSNPAGSGRRQR